MTTLTEAMLDAWEQGFGQAPGRRALTLLAAAGAPGTPEQWSAGARNRRLLELRARLFGPLLSSVVDCPQCGAALEFELSAFDLLPDVPDPEPAAAHEAQEGDVHVTFRLPDSAQLAAVGVPGDVTGAVQALRGACILHLEGRGEALSAAELPDTVWARLDREMAALDPLGTLELELVCPDCGHGWTAPLDVGEYLWMELGAWSEGVLRDVHELALAYGWSQAEILTLAPGRRERYLNLLRG